MHLVGKALLAGFIATVIFGGVVACCFSGAVPGWRLKHDPGSILLVIRSSGGLGSGAAVGERIAVTAAHVVGGSSWVTAAGREAHVFAVEGDFALLKIADHERSFTDWLPLGAPGTGTMSVLYLHGGWVCEARVGGRNIHGEWEFGGWRPSPGQSGSPVVQSGRVVGVVSRMTLPMGGVFEESQ